MTSDYSSIRNTILQNMPYAKDVTISNDGEYVVFNIKSQGVDKNFYNTEIRLTNERFQEVQNGCNDLHTGFFIPGADGSSDPVSSVIFGSKSEKSIGDSMLVLSHSSSEDHSDSVRVSMDFLNAFGSEMESAEVMGYSDGGPYTLIRAEELAAAGVKVDKVLLAEPFSMHIDAYNGFCKRDGALNGVKNLKDQNTQIIVFGENGGDYLYSVKTSDEIGKYIKDNYGLDNVTVMKCNLYERAKSHYHAPRYVSKYVFLQDKATEGIWYAIDSKTGERVDGAKILNGISQNKADIIMVDLNFASNSVNNIQKLLNGQNINNAKQAVSNNNNMQLFEAINNGFNDYVSISQQFSGDLSNTLDNILKIAESYRTLDRTLANMIDGQMQSIADVDLSKYKNFFSNSISLNNGLDSSKMIISNEMLLEAMSDTNIIISTLHQDLLDTLSIKNSIDSFVTDSSSKLLGSDFDIIRDKMNDFSEICTMRMNYSETVISAINESCKSMLEYLEKYGLDNIDTSLKPEFEKQRDDTIQSINELQELYDSIPDVSYEVGEDGKTYEKSNAEMKANIALQIKSLNESLKTLENIIEAMDKLPDADKKAATSFFDKIAGANKKIIDKLPDTGKKSTTDLKETTGLKSKVSTQVPNQTPSPVFGSVPYFGGISVEPAKVTPKDELSSKDSKEDSSTNAAVKTYSNNESYSNNQSYSSPAINEVSSKETEIESNLEESITELPLEDLLTELPLEEPEIELPLEPQVVEPPIKPTPIKNDNKVFAKIIGGVGIAAGAAGAGMVIKKKMDPDNDYNDYSDNNDDDKKDKKTKIDLSDF